MRPLDLGISFADADIEHLHALEKQLRPLERSGTLRVWHRRKLDAGKPLADADERLAAADLVVLLVSPDHHDERFEEASDAVVRHGADGRVVPVLVRATTLQGTPYEHLVKLPKDGSAIAGAADRDAAWTAVVKDLLEMARGLPVRAKPAEPAADARATPPTFTSSTGRSDATSERPAPAPEHIAIGRLPVPGRHFFGREAELARLDAAWEDAGTRVVSIVAMGGAGKSALVDRWLKGMQKQGWRGAERVYGWSFYSQGSSNTASGDMFIAAALAWFGDADPTAGNAWDKGERLARLVKQRRTLLVLDGLEPLQAPPGPDEGKLRDPGVAALLRDLSASGRGLCVVSTRVAVADLASREDGPAPRIDLEQLSAEDGARLLAVLGVKGAEAELRAAAVERKGHALALSLLGSYLAEACEGDVRRRTEAAPLESDASGAAHAAHVMDAYARWFGEGPEVAVLRLLGLFDRPADEGCLRALRTAPPISGLTDTLLEPPDGGSQAAGARPSASRKSRAVSPDVRWNQAVARLRRARLVAEAAESEPGTIDAHPLVREHFGRRLCEEAPEAWREGHGRLFEHLQKVAPEFPETTEAMAPLYAAVVHGCHAERRQEALDEVLWKRVYRGKEGFNMKQLGAFGTQLGMLAAFFDPPWSRVAPGLTEADEAFVLNEASFALRAFGRLGEAIEPLQMALERSVAQQDRENAAVAAGSLSELHLDRGAVADAMAVGRQAVELADWSGDGGWRMAVRTALAHTLHQAGHAAEAAALFEEAEALQKREWPTAALRYSVRRFRYRDLLLDQGQFEVVLDNARDTLAWAKPRRFLLDIALDHLSLGRVHFLLALRDQTLNPAVAFTSARAEIDEAVTGLRQAGHQDDLPRGLLARAELHLATGDLPAAQHDLDEALDIATRGGMRLHEADAHLGFTRLHLARADHDAARASLAAARALIHKSGYHRRDPDLAELEAALARP